VTFVPRDLRGSLSELPRGFVMFAPLPPEVCPSIAIKAPDTKNTSGFLSFDSGGASSASAVAAREEGF
jgi:hypothetical protein